MRKMKKQKNNGITLIALIITIIVLLILAGVSIATLTGDNGILRRASDASEKTGIANVKEMAQTDILGKQAENNGDISKEEFVEILNKYFNDVPTADELPEDLSTVVLPTKEEYGTYKINISEIWNKSFTVGTKGITANDIANAEDKSQYYGAIVTGYTCTNSAGVNNWKIFYADSSNIYLITDDYIHYDYCPPSATQTIYKPVSYKDYELSMKNVILDYPDGSAHITDSKIKALNNDYFNVKGYTSEYGNMKAVAYMLDTNVWSSFAGENAEYAIGGPTIEMLMKSYSQKYHVDYRAQVSSDKGYEISIDGGKNWANTYMEALDKNDSLYVIKSSSKAGAMWMASPSASTSSYVMDVIFDGSISIIGYGDRTPGFRPVVCLKSSVQLEDQEDGTYIIK